MIANVRTRKGWNNADLTTQLIFGLQATGVCIIAPITKTKEAHKAWTKALQDASKFAAGTLQDIA